MVIETEIIENRVDEFFARRITDSREKRAQEVASAPTQDTYLARRCRYRVVKYLIDAGLDIGCGDERIVPQAIGVDPFGRAANLNIDAGDLSILADNKMPYVFASHILSYFIDWKKALAEWWRVLKPGHYFVLYDGMKGLWPKAQSKEAHECLVHNLEPADIKAALKKMGCKFSVASEAIYEDERSYELILEKLEDKGQPVKKEPKDKRMVNAPRYNCNGQPKAMVCRYGGFGDHIMASAILPLLKEKGYYTIYNTSEKGFITLKDNPHVDYWLLQHTGAIPPAELGEYWIYLEKQVDKFIQLNSSIEAALLATAEQDAFYLSHEERHKLFNRNYYDYTFERSGFPEAAGKNGELYFSNIELGAMRSYFNKWKHKFIILWALSGSALHKAYPYSIEVQQEFLRRHPDVVIITAGDAYCQLLEEPSERCVAQSGKWGIRKTLTAVKLADLVIGPETGVLNAAGCFNIPKICMLSHSSKENLTKHWTNDYSLEPEGVPCAPCHRLFKYTDDHYRCCKEYSYEERDCPVHGKTGQPACSMVSIGEGVERPACVVNGISPQRLFDTMETVYRNHR